MFFFNSFNIGITLLISSCSSIFFEPGLVDSPPISIISAPSCSIFFACSTADKTLLNLPPSENESGVTFNIPIIIVFLPISSFLPLQFKIIFPPQLVIINKT